MIMILVIKSSTSNTNICDLFFLCSAKCSSGVESFSGRTTISVEKSKKAQLVRMKGKVRWGRPSTLGSHNMRKAALEIQRARLKRCARAAWAPTVVTTAARRNGTAERRGRAW